MNKKMKQKLKKYNHLASEKSPYLLQHRGNPVDWYPWCGEAFEKAAREDKPVFLSIGYSTCHWCHVMARESFEDGEVAKLMNDAFVCIKVDREERPDIDSVYMSVCQAMTGAGGWPLTIIMTPSKKPFFSATYIPVESRFGMAGMLDIIPRIREMWENNRGEILRSADTIFEHIKKDSTGFDREGEKIELEINESILDFAYSRLLKSFDEKSGGFGGAPKFPSPHNLLFLLRFWKRTGNKNSLFMVEKTLDKMCRGGIYDLLGYGFHRYSTDSRWRVPHFEKMLYDQAMLSMAYTEAFQATGKKEYSKTAGEILTYILRDMKSGEGGFYSAEDADSEGIEGKFYTWTLDEISEVIEDENLNLIVNFFNIEKEGNFSEQAGGEKAGRNILYIDKIPQGFDPGLVEKAREKLFRKREKRVHPFKDDKILTDWNGLAIAALSKAAQAFESKEYERAARDAADFILVNMRSEDSGLLHRYREGVSEIKGNLDDYSFFIWGLLELYEANFDVNYLKAAIELNDYLIKHFWDDENGGFYFTPNNGEKLIVRRKEIYDGAIPSGNSASLLNLLRLWKITGNNEFENKARVIIDAFSNQLRNFPQGYSFMLSGLCFALGPSHEIVIVGEEGAWDTKNMLKILRSKFIPDKVVIFSPSGENAPEITEISKFTKNLTKINGKATAYVCSNYTCKKPATDIGEVIDGI